MRVFIQIKKESPDKEGRCVLFFVIYDKGAKTKISAGVSVMPDAFVGSSIVKHKDEPHWEKKNLLLQNRLAVLVKGKTEMEMSGRIFTKEDLKDYYIAHTTEIKKNEDVENQVTIEEYVKIYQDRYADQHKEKTILQYRQLADKIREFSPGLPAKNLNRKTISDFVNFLLGKGLQNNTIRMSYLKMLKRVSAEIQSDGHQIPTEIFKYNWKKNNNEIFFATWEEVEAIRDVELTQFSSQAVRDMWVFGCYTGLRHSDLKMIRKSSVTKRGSRNMLRVIVVKTEKDYVIPIPSVAMGILERYNYKFPEYSHQFHNVEIKKIAGKVIKGTELKSMFSGATRTDKEVDRSERFSTHTARRTFARNFLDKGGSLVVLSMLLGHSNTEVTLRYTGYQSKEMEDEFWKVMEG